MILQSKFKIIKKKFVVLDIVFIFAYNVKFQKIFIKEMKNF